MNKLLALIPLLGWFYITVIVFVVFSWVTKRKYGFIKKLYYGVFTALALFLAVGSLLNESKLYEVSKTTLFSPFKQKIANEAGNYYEDYYLGFHPAISRSNLIYISNISQRELFYAKMYLYPGEVLAHAIPNIRTLVIMDTSQLKGLKRSYTLVRQSQNKSLVQLEEVR